MDRAGLLKAISQQYRVKKQQRGDDEDDDDDDDEDMGPSKSRDKYEKMRQQYVSSGLECLLTLVLLLTLCLAFARLHRDEPKAGKGKGPKKEGEGGYRDRAEERRKGHNPDYDDEIAKLVDMDAEKTKYLGGDLKHTHLVKGLDFALLNKVRLSSRSGVGWARKEGGEKRDSVAGF